MRLNIIQFTVYILNLIEYMSKKDKEKYHILFYLSFTHHPNATPAL